MRSDNDLRQGSEGGGAGGQILSTVLTNGQFAYRSAAVPEPMTLALPTVVGGLVSVPVIAVPTSVGYGASFSGIAALLGMLNSCSANVTVVNIDNGFGAGYVAALTNRLAEKE